MSAEPKVEDLLASIRKAIDDEESPLVTSVEEQGTLTRGSIREMRIAYSKPETAQPAPRNDGVDDLAALRSRVARSSVENAAATPPAPKFRVDPVSIETPPQVAPPQARPPKPVAFAELLSGAGDTYQRQKPAPVAQTIEPPYLRRSHNDAGYDDEIADVTPDLPIVEEPRYSSRPVRPEPVYRAPEPPHWPTNVEEESYDYDPEPPPPPELNPYSPPLMQPAPPPPAPPAAPPPYRAQNALVSHEQSHTTRRSFDDLAEAVLSRATNDRGLEDMTRDLLRNYLSRWLDEHLPSLVEQLVREEIERVARRGN